ncbi:hypothetical protein AAVH_25580 [Aphelenchoides avenae]|nr:hypothetical protein AAVH_25580 [Aphelenchus avenae]
MLYPSLLLFLTALSCKGAEDVKQALVIGDAHLSKPAAIEATYNATRIESVFVSYAEAEVLPSPNVYEEVIAYAQSVDHLKELLPTIYKVLKPSKNALVLVVSAETTEASEIKTSFEEVGFVDVRVDDNTSTTKPFFRINANKH